MSMSIIISITTATSNGNRTPSRRPYLPGTCSAINWICFLNPRDGLLLQILCASCLRVRWLYECMACFLHLRRNGFRRFSLYSVFGFWFCLSGYRRFMYWGCFWMGNNQFLEWANLYTLHLNISVYEVLGYP